jgi:hypothetical protein
MMRNVLFLIAALAATMLFSCASPQKMLDKGSFDAAIRVSAKRLTGKKNKKTKHVLVLQEAFAKATERDMSLAERLRRENRPENWEVINSLYLRVRQRQERIAPLLPLVSKDGIRANFKFVRVDELEYESRENAADYLYNRAEGLLSEARRQGDKLAAREAYDELVKIDQYFRDFKDKERLKREAHELGTTYILVRLQNNSRAIMPAALEQEIRRISVRELNSFWRTFLTERARGHDFDYEIVMNISEIVVGPDQLREREFEEAKEIEEGFDYVLDRNGNVMKDSLGNDIKVPRKVFIRARVIEAHQTKVASIAGRLELFDIRNRELLETRPMAADAIFENYASTFQGDRRALSEETLKRIGNQPVPFPTDEGLLFMVAEQLKPVIKNHIAGMRRLI